MTTGTLFHIKHRYAEAYEALKVPAPVAVAWGEARLSPSEVVSQGLLGREGPLALALHPSGRPVYLGVLGGEARAVDVRDGALLALADVSLARSWAVAAVGASAHAARYGAPVGAPEEVAQFSALLGRDVPAFRFRFSGGKAVTVNRLTGEVAQTGELNDFIDFTYRLHYLQWTPWQPVNVALVAVAIPLVLGLAFTGLRMAFGRRAPSPPA
jgi:hypothetical protein